MPSILSRSRNQSISAIQRFAIMLLALMLAWQLVASARHQHALGDLRSDCASCLIGANFPSNLPTPAVLVAPKPALLAYALQIVTLTLPIVVPAFFLPFAHAPPI